MSLTRDYTGFVVDAFNCAVQTTDGNYQCISGSSAEVNITGEEIDIFGGLSFYPLAKIDSKKSITVNINDASLSMYSMGLNTGGTLSENAVKTIYKFGTVYTVGSSPYTIVIPEVVSDASSIKINGLAYQSGGTPSAGQFCVTITTNTTITFFSDMGGKTVMPLYPVSTTANKTAFLATKDTDFAKSGTVYINFPIYGDYSSSSSSSIIADGYITIPKGKIKTSLKIGGSYKSASQFTTQIDGLFAGSGQSVYEFTYVLR
jgi:hypothetical protein